MNTVQIILAIGIFVINAFIGSFLFIVVYSVPRKISIIKSITMQPTYSKIPILSFFIDQNKFSLKRIIIELLTVLCSIIIYLKYGFSFEMFYALILSWHLIVISFIDAEFYIIPDCLNLGIFVLGIISFFIPLGNIKFTDRIIGIVFSLIITILMITISKLIKKEIIGGGDLKLFIGISLVIGWELLIVGIFLGSLLALIIGVIIKKVFRFTSHNEIPFGPYLAFSFMIMYLYGTNIIEFYLKIIIR